MTFYETLLAHGLRPRAEPQPDGRWRRCPTEEHPKKKNGAYKLTTDGLVGFFQDWAVHPEPLTWRPEGAESLPAADYQAIRRRNREAEAEQARRVRAARAEYARCSPLLGGHPYLESHGLDMTGCRGLKVDARGRLVVPMGRDGQLVSLQRISADGTKKFWAGAPTSGTRYVLERRRATLTVLCEGLATGLALYAAVPTARVVVALTAGNLPRVAATLPRKGMAVVAADNDHETEARTGENPGVRYAREAAALLGCEVAIPTGIEGTDWCDLRLERLATLKERPSFGRWEKTTSELRRAVDAEIRREVLRASRFLPVSA